MKDLPAVSQDPLVLQLKFDIWLCIRGAINPVKHITIKSSRLHNGLRIFLLHLFVFLFRLHSLILSVWEDAAVLLMGEHKCGFRAALTVDF